MIFQEFNLHKNVVNWPPKARYPFLSNVLEWISNKFIDLPINWIHMKSIPFVYLLYKFNFKFKAKHPNFFTYNSLEIYSSIFSEVESTTTTALCHPPGNWQLQVREINPLVEIIGFTNGVSRTEPSKGRSITLPMTSWWFQFRASR